MYPRVTLKAGRDGAVQSGHPWVFSGAVEAVSPEAADGGLVTVEGAGGHFLGHGYYNGRSSIRVRVLTRQPRQAIDEGFWRQRLARALSLREGWFDPAVTDGYRWVNGEGDGLPGLVVDRYGPHLVAQFHTLGMEARRETLLALLDELASPESVVERSDLSVRRMEGLAPRAARMLAGEVPAEGWPVRENGLSYRVDPLHGQKTGHYFDQRDNRALVERLAGGRRVLDAYAYTGGFTLAALRGGAAEVVSVESSAGALQRLRGNLERNGLDAGRHRAACADVAAYLEADAPREGPFGMIVLDPPAFVKHRGALTTGLRAYRRLNRNALRLLASGGVLVTASCSAHVAPEAWEGVLTSAARSAGRTVQVLQETLHPLDHPVQPPCWEARYLTCLFARVGD